ncbi:CHASE2 domain-containing protein [Caballeronia sp. SEWSISQ10-4 2]|uniref:CHASE2 domain-containing protein n=1 Tax=Caballeronia sp. SEWSISQ10-4 2 TaxID=2937438 RepID=UPI002655A9E2|nr:CHASE2 domain-containing protein [Caballeronia sp. SEWSISQ10-4 2]MDN7182357.1 CHASE2 domain-containing protein [Caballeronia sp. SEWSISQ10-4 2]
MPWRFPFRDLRWPGPTIGKRFFIEWMLIGAVGVAAVLCGVVSPLTERASFLIYDQLLSHSASRPSAGIVIVAVDDESIAELGRWPWPRETHAALLDQLAKAKPASVAYDVLFTEPSPGDAAFAQAMKHVPTYLPLLVDRLPVNQNEPAAVEPVPVLRAAAAGVGHIDLEVNQDGIVRSVSLFEGSGKNWWPSITVPVYRAMRGPDAPLPGIEPAAADAVFAASGPAGAGELKRAHRMMIPFSRTSLDYPRVSFAAAMQGSVPPEFFAGKIVLVGATAAGLRDRFATPISGDVGELPGVDIYATILDALFDGRAIEPVSDRAAGWTSLMPIGILLAGLLVMSPFQSLILTIALACASLIASACMVYLRSRWLSPVPALGGLALIYLLWSWRRLEVAMSYLGQELRLLAAEPNLLPGAEQKPQGAAGDLLERLIALTRQAVQRQRNMRQFIWDSLNSLPEPIMVCDRDGRILMVNDPARLHFGPVRFNDMSIVQIFSDFHFVRLVDEDSSGALPSGMSWPAMLDPRVERHAEVMMHGIEVRDRHGRDHMLRYAPCTTSAGGSLGWIASWVDITALHASERQRDDMLHLLSHDMRSPQASILALLDTERPHIDSTRAMDLMERVERYARRTLALADDFVQLARAESQHYSLELLNLHELAIDASDEIWPLAHAKDIEVRCESEGEAFWVLADRSLMTRALINLLSNAVKYSPPATRVGCIVSETPGAIVCVVQDMGYGIALEQQAHLFERFRRFHLDGQPPSDGTGLGMAFVKTVISRHAGEIAIKSAPDRGTTVTITLRAQTVEPREASDDEPAAQKQ